jgi:hypothetical protein
MTDRVFEKALADFLAEGGGSATLTPIVGDALIDPQFLQRVRRLRSEPRIDRIRLVTNGILLDRFGIPDIVRSGLTFLAISVPGFDPEIYERIYRSKSYARVRDNILAVLEENERAGRPIEKISILIRSDRPYEELSTSPDFQQIARYSPGIHVADSFSSFIERITPESLPAGNVRLPDRRARRRRPCLQLLLRHGCGRRSCHWKRAGTIAGRHLARRQTAPASGKFSRWQPEPDVPEVRQLSGSEHA